MALSGLLSGKPKPAGKLKRSLHAWWNGYERPAASGRAASPEPQNGARFPGDGAGDPSPDSKPWRQTHPPAHVSELLWGRGFTTPGGEEFVLDLVRHIGIDETMTLLDIGAGLGGSCRVIAGGTGIWTTGLEESEALAKAGTVLSKAAGMGRKAPLLVFDPTDPLDRVASSTNVVFSKECLFSVADKQALLAEVERVLKPNGYLVLTDYVRRGAKAAEEALARWREGEPRPCTPWSVAEYESHLAELGFVLNISQDLTAKYKAEIARGWRDFQDRVDRDSLPPAQRSQLLDELALWAGRLDAIANGAIAVRSIVAYKSEFGSRESRFGSIDDALTD